MQRWVLFIAAVSAVLSCSRIIEVGGENSHASAPGRWGNLDLVQGNHASDRMICYMTVLDYQKGYDWKSDRASESVKCSLAVYVDGVPVMKVPVGEMYETGADSDMHRIVQGHLYTDYSTEHETVIKKDGVTLFRYQGRESLCGLEVLGGNVYTLGQSRNGDGFTFRKNGEIVYEREQGNIIGDLQSCGDTLSYAFYESISSDSDDICRYYKYVNGRITQIAVRDDIKKVWDIMLEGDCETYVASLTGVLLPVIVKGESMRVIALPLGSSLVTCRLFEVSDRTGAEGIYRAADGNMYNAVWLDGLLHHVLPAGKILSSLDVSGDGVFCTANPSSQEDCGVIYRCGDVYDMPEGYMAIGQACVCVIDGVMHAGLSSSDCDKPLLWKDGEIDSLRVNGYVSGVYAESARSVLP